MKKSEKMENPLLLSIRTAHDKLLIQQDIYRKKYDGPSVDKETVEAELSEMPWPDFLESMADFHFPVDESRLKYFLCDPKQFVDSHEARIKNIADDDIRFELHHLNQINVHTQRIKVIAELHYRFGNLDEYESLASYWLTYSQCLSISNAIDDDTALIPYNENISKLKFHMKLNELMLTLFLASFKELIDC